MNFDLTQIVSAIVALCAAVITYVIIPYIKSKTDEQKQEELLKWVKIAVAAAEQIYKQNDGELKKQTVLAYLKEKGYDIDAKEIDNAVEAAVIELHNSLNKPVNN